MRDMVLTLPPTVTMLWEKKIPAGVARVEMGKAPLPPVEVRTGLPREPSEAMAMETSWLSEVLVFLRK